MAQINRMWCELIVSICNEMLTTKYIKKNTFTIHNEIACMLYAKYICLKLNGHEKKKACVRRSITII